MAQKEATLILKLKDLASQGMGGVSNSLSKLKANFLAVSAAVAGLTAFAVSAIKAYAEQENAVNKLNVALKNQGVFTHATSKDLQNFATQLQNVTTFADEAIVEAQALLTTFGLTGNQLKETTKAALDLSTGLGIDLKAATLLLGKAALGETSTLSRYGITISESIPVAQKFDAALAQVNQRFGGSAEAAISTTTGKIENLSNRLGDLKERIGAELIPVVEFWTKQLERAVGWLEKLGVATNDDLQGRELTIQKLKEEMAALIEKSTVEGTYHDETIQRRLLNYEDAILREQGLLANEQAATHEKQTMALSHQQFLEQQATKEAEREKKKNEKLKKERVAHDALIKKLDEQLAKDKEAWHNQQIEWDKKMSEVTKRENEIRTQNIQSTLNTISTLSTAHNKGLAAIGKAAALAMAYINTSQAITVALASAPPPFNFALAAAVGAAGAVQVANIAGVQLAEGGIVLPRAGGTQATIGEAGKAEAVIPLDDDRAGEMLGGMGDVIININAGTIVADDYSIREFAEKIDAELFRMQRTKRSVAF